MAGLQCHKRLWWTVHEPAAPELTPDKALQHRFDMGIRVGAAARGFVPGGVLIDLPYRAYDERIQATEAALQSGAPRIYEAAFRASDVFVSVDILDCPSARAAVIEVKSTNRVKEEHVPDVAAQAHVVGQCGVEVSRLEIMHLNRACAYPDLSDLFVRDDVTALAQDALEAMPGVLRSQLAMLAGPLPDVAVGDHCTKPHDCPFLARCWPTPPPHHVSTLYRGGATALELEEQGYATIHDLPDDIPLNGPIQDRQRRAVQTGQVIVAPAVAAALREFQPPLAYLDFETVALPIPIWNGCHPWDQVPVQFSCHVDVAGGGVSHHEWLADGPGDPRPALAERLVRACEAARSVVAYNASFERRCLLQMADALPAQGDSLRRIADRLVDLLPVVRNHIYHPDFGGSFSLKSVLPAMVPELRYDTLAIGDGAMASLELERLLFREAELTAETKAQLRSDLLRYCGQDTWGLVKLLERLRQLARS